MARNKARRGKVGKLKPAQLNLSYTIVDGTTYIDLFSDLSKINRRLYKQGKVLAVAGLTFGYSAGVASPDVVALAVFTAGDTWSVHNAWKKAKIVWTNQQRRARKLIGLSAKPTWEDFKVYLDDAHRVGTIGQVLAGDGAAVSAGEWDYSRLVHVDDAEASFDEWYMHIIGGNVADTDKGLILNYQESRATVQAEDPDLPDEYSTNMYAMLAEDVDLASGEVAQNMESENDEPPYDQDDYPGSDVNADFPWLQQTAVAAIGSPLARCPGFQAECGLIMIQLAGSNSDGTSATAPPTTLTVHLMPGNYQGVLAENMGQ